MALGRGDWGIAQRLARRAAEAGLDSPDVLAVQGIALARLGCVGDAESCLLSALDQVSNSNGSVKKTTAKCLPNLLIFMFIIKP